jgi:hypothetical protein
MQELQLLKDKQELVAAAAAIHGDASMAFGEIRF